jgi:hypothetical protein
MFSTKPLIGVAIAAAASIGGGADAAAFLSRQDSSSIRWMASLEKSYDTPVLGERRLLGAQHELYLALSVVNFEGPTVWGIDALERTVRVSVSRESQQIPVTAVVSIQGQDEKPSLSPQESLRARIIVRRVDGAEFEPGRYALSTDLSTFFSALTMEDGRHWVGRSPLEDVRAVLIAGVRSQADRALFNETEANWHLGRRDYARALPYAQELTRLRANDWHAWATLGVTHLRIGQLSEAVKAFEAAMPGWLNLSDRRGDLLPNDLATAYLKLGNAAEAAGVFKRMGLSDEETRRRIQRLGGSPAR